MSGLLNEQLHFTPVLKSKNISECSTGYVQGKLMWGRCNIWFEKMTTVQTPKGILGTRCIHKVRSPIFINIKLSTESSLSRLLGSSGSCRECLELNHKNCDRFSFIPLRSVSWPHSQSSFLAISLLGHIVQPVLATGAVWSPQLRMLLGHDSGFTSQPGLT